MRIRTTHTALKTYYNAELMGDEYDPPGISFSKPRPDGTRTSQPVVKEVGERLVSELEGFEPLDSNGDGEDGTEETE